MTERESRDGTETTFHASPDMMLSSSDAVVSPELRVLGRPSPGDRVGSYVLIEHLGAGAYGSVWRAEQREPVRRTVAIKVLHASQEHRGAIARFSAEQQTLAAMNHPGVAKILDAGVTPGGVPYLVMEYIKGDTLVAYCDRERLTIDDRLQLFIEVCDAVHHAHLNGFVHCDLKPSNIMVTRVSGNHARAVIIDFGVSKALLQGVNRETLFSIGGHARGTWAYMSPEQAEGLRDIDQRSDIYSLGAVLYELLSGLRPFDDATLSNADDQERRRMICDLMPKAPSTRLTLAEASVADLIADRRSTSTRALISRLRKELEWIPLRALRKERSRRYDSALDLAKDIRNYLDGAPLGAGPESSLYRAKKVLRKHRAVSIAVGATILSLSCGLALSLWNASTVRSSKAELGDALAKSEQLLHVLSIREVESHIQRQNIHYAQELLASFDEDDRATWEWRYLSAQCDNSTRALTFPNAVVARVTEDGSLVTAVLSSGAIVTVDTTTWLERPPLHANAEPTSVSWSADGARFVVKHDDHEATLVDVRSMRASTIRGGRHEVPAKYGQLEEPELAKPDVVISACGRVVATHHDVPDRPLQVALLDESTPVLREYKTVWDQTMLRSWPLAPERHLVEHAPWGFTLIDIRNDKSSRPLSVESLAADPLLLPNATAILVSTDGVIWTTTPSMHWALHRPLKLEERERASCCVVSSGPNPTLCVGTTAGLIHIVSLDRDRVEDELPIDVDLKNVSALAITADGTWLFAQEATGVIQVVNLRDRTQSGILKGHTERLQSVALLPGGDGFVTTSVDSTVRTWELPSEPYAPRSVHPSTLSMALSSVRAGKPFVMASSPAGFRMPVDRNEASSSWSRNGNAVIVRTTENAGRLAVLRVLSGSDTHHEFKLSGHSKAVSRVAMSQLGERAATSDEETILVWDARNGSLVQRIQASSGNIRALDFSEDASILVVRFPLELQLWRVADGALLGTLRLSSHQDVVQAISSSARLIAVACGNEQIRLHQLHALDQPATPLKSSGGGGPRSLQFDRSGGRLLIAKDNSVSLYSTETCEPILHFPVQNPAAAWFAADESEVLVLTTTQDLVGFDSLLLRDRYRRRHGSQASVD